MCRTTPAEPSEPSEPVEPAPPLSSPIKGRHAPWANLSSRDLRASLRFVILSGKKRRM